MKQIEEDLSFTCSAEYISAACNSTIFSVDWNNNNVIGIAIENGIAILKPKLEEGNPGKIEKTVYAHKDRVNVVKWIESSHGFTFDQEYLITASVDNNAIVWTYKNEDLIPLFTITGSEGSVVDACLVNITLNENDNDGCLLAATMTMSSLKLWKKASNDENFSSVDIVHTSGENNFGASGLAVSVLPETETIILACTKKFVNISLYTGQLSDNMTCSFKEQVTLVGHANWINDLAFTYSDLSRHTLLLASSSHDKTIFIRRIELKSKADSEDSELGVEKIYISAENKDFCITVYSILYGHEQWIYSLHWKHFSQEADERNKLKLLSVSADKTIIIWGRDFSIDTWVENYRLGDVGGNVSGFLGGKFNPSGEFVLSYDLRGAFHMWKYHVNNDCWLSQTLPHGHFDKVNDIQWDPKGQFLLSVSADKTTRLHAPWRENHSYWFEFARPQTHGYTISCITALPDCRFVSGAEEKEMRFFMAPKTVIDVLKRSSFLQIEDENKYTFKNAILPSLDLSNKASEDIINVTIELDQNQVSPEIGNSGEFIHSIPTEDELSRNTLWPEVQKLYFHPNEVTCLVCNRDGSLIASACKANASKFASVAVWSLKNWNEFQKIQELNFHQLTVTQLAFSPNDSYLLSVSRDRTWCLYKNNAQKFETVAYTSTANSVHKRQLHCCSWTHDSKYFATGSRDGKLVIWGKEENIENADPTDCLNGYRCNYETSIKDDIRSVSFAPVMVASYYVLGVGFGSGKINVYIWSSVDPNQFRLCLVLNESLGHIKSINKITFCPEFCNEEKTLLLATCGDDRLVKIHKLAWTTDH